MCVPRNCADLSGFYQNEPTNAKRVGAYAGRSLSSHEVRRRIEASGHESLSWYGSQQELTSSTGRVRLSFAPHLWQQAGWTPSP